MTEYMKITSRKNETVIRTAALLKRGERNERRAFITEGMKLFLEAHSAGFCPSEVFVREDFLKTPDGKRFVSLNRCEKTYTVTREVYDKMTDESSPEGLLCVFEQFALTPFKNSVILLLEDIRDPGNLGTILRSAAAFGAREVVGTGCSDGFSPKTVRATMGALFRLPYTSFDTLEEAVSYVKGTTDKLYAACLSERACDIAEVDTSTACVMIGNEGHGLSAEAVKHCEREVIIPIEAVESLNASTAASIILYDAFRKRNANGK